MTSERPKRVESVPGSPLDYASSTTESFGTWDDSIHCFCCGAMLCVPVITAIFAFVFARSVFREPHTRAQRSVAILGLVLAGLNCALWGGPFVIALLAR